jgi:hypothetical protein
MRSICGAHAIAFFRRPRSLLKMAAAANRDVRRSDRLLFGQGCFHQVPTHSDKRERGRDYLVFRSVSLLPAVCSNPC